MPLNKDTICSMPFITIHDSAPSSFSPCCHIDDSKFKKYKKIKDYLASSELQSLKDNLLNGIKDTRCNYCWKAEKLKMRTLRQDSINDERFDKINDGKIRQVNIQTGYVCNISCMMCSPGVSSNLNQLWKGKSLAQHHTWWNGPKLEYNKESEKYIKENINDIQYIDAVGGEPLYNKKYIALLDCLLENNVHKNITLYITTNGTLLSDTICKKLLKFKKVVILTSIDGIGQVNDYIRWGSKFSVVEKNFIKSTKLFDHMIATCVSALNVHRYNEIKEFAEAHNSQIDYKMVKDIPALDPWNVPEEFKKDICHEHKDISKKTSNTKALFEYIRLWDSQRSINIKDYMPEFGNLNGNNNN